MQTLEQVPMESQTLKGFSYYLMFVTNFLIVCFFQYMNEDSS